MQGSFLPADKTAERQRLKERLEALLPQGADTRHQWMRRGLVAAAVIVVYVLIALIVRATLSDVFTASWMAGAIPWIAAPIGIALALAGLVRASVWSLAGYVIATIIGEMIGGPIFGFQNDYLTSKLEDPAYIQSWEPVHVGWVVALGLFLYISAVAAVVEWREQRDPEPAAIPAKIR